jgi:hypothetical protein
LFSDADGTLTLKLADFGLALNLREERAVTRVGTLGGHWALGGVLLSQRGRRGTSTTGVCDGWQLLMRSMALRLWHNVTILFCSVLLMPIADAAPPTPKPD